METLQSIHTHVSLAELRLDLMREFDLRLLVTQSPCQLILTNRPLREGGRWEGSERERIATLIEGIRLGVSHIDIEWDSYKVLLDRGVRSSHTRVIVSHHALDGMPSSLRLMHDSLSKSGADVVKIVGRAETASDTIQMLELLSETAFPTIALATGSAGTPGRLLCLRIDSCYLSYVAITNETPTAEGQISLSDALDIFRAHSIDKQTAAYGYLAPIGEEAVALRELNVELANQGVQGVCIPIHVERHSLADTLTAYETVPVQGYAVGSDFQQSAYHVVDLADACAMRQGLVDTIVRREGILFGIWFGCSDLDQLSKRQVSAWKTYQEPQQE